MDVQVHSLWDALSIQQVLDSLKCTTSLPPMEKWIYIIQKCRANKNLAIAKCMHMHVHENGLEVHRSVGNYLVPMLVECGGMSDARQAFRRLAHRNEHAWTSLIQGFVDCGECQHALNLFQSMQDDCVHPSRFTLQALLKACARLKSLEEGWEIHSKIFMAGYDVDPFVGNTLVDMYAKCGSFSEAWEVFCMLPCRDVITWNALMSGCTEHMLCEEALRYSKEMRLGGVCPSIVTFLCTLKACSSIKAIDRARRIHAEIVEEGLEKDSYVGNALVDMYAKCDSPLEALEVFCELKHRGVDSWNTLITGYSEQGLGEEALGCLEQMQLAGVPPDEVTFICSLKVCGDAGFIDKGRRLHGDVLKEGFEIDPFLGNTLVDMYAKCGSLGEAQKVFDNLLVRDLVSWNALLAGYARRGEIDKIFSCIEMMMHDGVRPDWITFLSALSACNHSGLVGYGQKFFKSMTTNYGIVPTVGHKSCIIDLFGRAGQLGEGLTVMAKLSPHSNTGSWQLVVDSCQSRGGVHTGRHAFIWAIRLGDNDGRACALMPNFYAEAHIGKDVEDVMYPLANTETWKGVE